VEGEGEGGAVGEVRVKDSERQRDKRHALKERGRAGMRTLEYGW